MKPMMPYFLLALLTACSIAPWDPVEHQVSVERKSSDQIEISDINIHEAGEGIAIYGKLSARSVTDEIPRGHVNIEVIARDGTAMFRTSTDLHQIGKLFKKPERYSFTAAIPITPPEGSSIRVNYEDEP